jgi:predicted SAM-dependent methyltransferase
MAKKKIKLSLACGQNKPKGFIGVDIVKTKDVDIVGDLTVFPDKNSGVKSVWEQWEDNSVDEVECSHFIEHLTGDQFMQFMNQLYRIMKKGAVANIVAPYYTSMRAIQDPTHRQFISEASFLYYNKEWRKNNGLDHYPIKADFDFTYGYTFDNEWISRNDEIRQFALKHYWNVVMDIHIQLTRR